MNQHVLEYHVYLIEFYERIGNIHAAKHHLKLAWMVKRES